MKTISSSTKVVLISLLALGLISCNQGSSDKKIQEWVEKNPDVIMKSIMEYQRKQQEDSMPKAADVEANSESLFKHAGSPTAGAAEGKIKIAYFFDFLCGHCEVQSKTNAAVLEKRTDVQIIYKNLPILSEFSQEIAQAALAAHLQGKYKAYYDSFFATPKPERNPAALKKIAQKLGLDMKKWEADRNGETVMNEINHVRELAAKMKVNGTPALAIAPNIMVPGRADGLAQMIEKL